MVYLEFCEGLLCVVALTEYVTVMRKVKDAKNAPDVTADCSQQLQRLMGERMLEFRWLLEELRTPQPVSIKRLEKAWGQLTY